MSEDGDGIKALIVIVIAVVLLVGLVTVVSSQTQPGYHSETRNGQEILRPEDDIGGEWGEMGVSGCIVHSDCVDDVGTPDGNSTYLWKNYTNPAEEDQHILSDLARPDITITGVTAWSVARWNATGGVGYAYEFGLSFPHLAGYMDCTPKWTGDLSLAFTNYSLVLPKCIGIDWTQAFVDNTTFKQGPYGINYNMTVTSEGVTVTYTYTVSVQDYGPIVDLTLLLPFIIIVAVVLVIVTWAIVRED